MNDTSASDGTTHAVLPMVAPAESIAYLSNRERRFDCLVRKLQQSLAEVHIEYADDEPLLARLISFIKAAIKKAQQHKNTDHEADDLKRAVNIGIQKILARHNAGAAIKGYVDEFYKRSFSQFNNTTDEDGLEIWPEEINLQAEIKKEERKIKGAATRLRKNKKKQNRAAAAAAQRSARASAILAANPPASTKTLAPKETADFNKAATPEKIDALMPKTVATISPLATSGIADHHCPPLTVAHETASCKTPTLQRLGSLSPASAATHEAILFTMPKPHPYTCFPNSCLSSPPTAITNIPKQSSSSPVASAASLPTLEAKLKLKLPSSTPSSANASASSKRKRSKDDGDAPGAHTTTIKRTKCPKIDVPSMETLANMLPDEIFMLGVEYGAKICQVKHGLVFDADSID